MTQLVYLLDISRADSAKALHTLRASAAADGDLNQRERIEIGNAIGRRFGALNGEVVNHVPRSSQPGWTIPVRIPAAERIRSRTQTPDPRT